MTAARATQFSRLLRVLGLGVGASILLLTLACTGSDDRVELDPELALLRLPDVPPGYTVGDDSGCGAITFESASERLAAFLRTAGVAPFCTRQLENYSDPDRPEVVMSSIVTLSSEEAASDALDILEELVRWQLGLDTDEELAPPDGPGGERRALAVASDSFLGPGAVYGWRSGPHVQYVAVTGSATPDGLARAVELSGVQQGRLDEPSPLTKADVDDAEVALDRVGAHPVYWLGTTWDPGDGDLPQLEIRESWANPEQGVGPGFAVEIDYVTVEGHGGGLDVGTWSPERWQQFLDGELGQEVVSRCDRPRVIRLDDRRIEIHGLGGGADCFSGAAAYVYFDDAVVTLNMPVCLTCGPKEPPWGSPDTLEVAASALERRP